MPPDSIKTCRACGTRRRLTDVLAVIHRTNGRREYVCRPSIQPRCFANVKAFERIERPGDPRNAA